MAEALANTTRIRTRPTRRVNASDVHIFADSYLASHRRRHSRWWGYSLEDSTIDLRPHQTQDQVGLQHTARTINFSRGGLKLVDIASGHDNGVTNARRRWANNVPAVTVLALGACDLNNTYMSNIPITELRRAYPRYVMGQIEDFMYHARRASNNTEQFDARVAHHRFLVCEPSNWGVDYEPRADLTAEEYRQRCTRAQCGLQRSRRRLWELYSTSVFTCSPASMQLRGWNQNHLDGASQEVFVGELLTAIQCLLCDTCTPQVDFYKEEHMRNHLTNFTCRRN